jgi:hypothetical protein
MRTCLMNRIDPENQFSDWKDLESKGRIADAVIVAVLVCRPLYH